MYLKSTYFCSMARAPSMVHVLVCFDTEYIYAKGALPSLLSET